MRAFFLLCMSALFVMTFCFFIAISVVFFKERENQWIEVRDSISHRGCTGRHPDVQPQSTKQYHREVWRVGDKVCTQRNSNIWTRGCPLCQLTLLEGMLCVGSWNTKYCTNNYVLILELYMLATGKWQKKLKIWRKEWVKSFESPDTFSVVGPPMGWGISKVWIKETIGNPRTPKKIKGDHGKSKEFKGK